MSGWIASIGSWWIDFLLLSTGLLLVILLSRRFVRQPVRRITMAVAALSGVVVLAVMCMLPGWQRVEIPVLFRSCPDTGSGGVPGDPARPRGPDILSIEVGETAGPVLETGGGPGVQTGRGEGAGTAWSPEQTRAVLGILFLTGFLLSAVWLVRGALQAAILCRRASRAPPWLEAELAGVVSGRSPLPQVLVSPYIANAVALGVGRPKILLPAHSIQDGPTSGLRAALAHEWAHIRSRDLWVLTFSRTMLLVLFAQPAFLWLRRRLREDLEFVADGRAAAETDRRRYAEELLTWARTGLARRVSRTAAALGIRERQSDLARRINMLLDERFQLETACSRRWRISVFGVLTVFAVTLSLLTLHPVAQTVTGNADGSGAIPGEAGEDLVFDCRVLDHDTGAGIAGSRVLVERIVRSKDPKRHRECIAMTEHVTDEDGRFRVVFPPEQVNNKAIYVQVSVSCDGYGSRMKRGYGMGMILKNLDRGERPFFEEIRLWPAKAVTGTLITPRGDPVPGVRVISYSRTTRKPEAGSFEEVTTDEKGRFRFMAVTPGKAIFWILPEDRMPSSHFINRLRGDFGEIVVQQGIRVKGRVLDAEGRPLAGIFLDAQGYDPVIGQCRMAVGSSIRRTAETDEEGNFEFAPLPAGRCVIKATPYRIDRSRGQHDYRKLPGIFYARLINVSPETYRGKSFVMAGVELRAEPHVTLEVQYVDSKGEPTSGWALHFSGKKVGAPRYGVGSTWSGSGRAETGENLGRVRMLVPKGLYDARLYLASNEHSAVRFQRKEGGPLHASSAIKLGRTDGDMTGMRIIRYVAPVVLFTVKAEEGEVPGEVKIRGEYATGDIDRKISVRKRKSDGRYKSSGLLPDEKAIFTVACAGYETRKIRIDRLAEGAIQEIAVVLVKIEEAGE